jgi:hypothetical protein
LPLLVIPAKAGIQCLCFEALKQQQERKSLDPRFRGDDEQKHRRCGNAAMRQRGNAATVIAQHRQQLPTAFRAK